MTKKVDLMMDPDDGKPQIVTKDDKKVQWRSRDYSGGESPPGFRIVFNALTEAQLGVLVDSSNPAITTDPNSGMAQLEAVAGADGKGRFFQAEIEFNNRANDDFGYRYSIWMGEMELDPRVRPK